MIKRENIYDLIFNSNVTCVFVLDDSPMTKDVL